MKTKKKIVISLLLLCVLAFSALTVYAAFYMEHKKKAEIGFFDLSDINVSFSYNLDLSALNSPNSYKELTLTAQLPSSEKNEFYEYYYIIKVDGQDMLSEPSSEAFKIAKSLFVYLDNEYVGTLYSLLYESELENEFKIKNDFFITYGETITNKLRFELHMPNSAGLFENKKLSLSIRCVTSTINVQTHTFVRDFFELKQALIQKNKTVILANDITLEDDITVTTAKTLDLRGKTLNFNGHNIIFNQDGTSKIKNSRGTHTFVPNGGGFVVAGGVLDIDESAVGAGDITTVVSCDTEAVTELLIKRFKEKIGFGLNSGQTKTSVFGELRFYLDGTITLNTSEHYTFSNNNLTASAQNTTQTTYIDIGEERIYFKIFGETDMEDLNGVLNSLSYLAQLENVDISYSVYLPTSISEYNAKIEWKSSDPLIMTNTGVAVSGGSVYLTAIIKVNNTVVSHTFKLNIANQSNEQRFQAILSAIGTIELDSVGIQNAVTIPDDGLLETYDLVRITYTLDPIYDYISLQEKMVWLNKVTFKRFAQIGIEVEFATGTDNPTDVNRKIFNGHIRVDIALGTSNTDLQQMVLAYVEGELAKVNVLQNILDTRAAFGYENEKGDFILPTEYEGFEIEYVIGSNIATVDGGNIIIHADKFPLAPALVEILVKVRIPDPDGGTPTYPAEKSMYFTVPAAIHNNNDGFADINVFRSIRHQVLQQVGALNIEGGQTYTLDTKDYILMHDIERCDTLILQNGAKTPKTTYTVSDLTQADDSSIYHFQISNLNASVDGIKYFTNLERLSILSGGTQMFDTNDKALAFLKYVSAMYSLTRLEMQYCRVTSLYDISGLSNLTYIDFIGNTGIVDLSPLIKLKHELITYLDLSGTTAASQSNANFNYEIPLFRNIYYRSYYAHSNTAPYIYYSNTGGTRTRYTITVNNDEATAYMLLFRLSEINDAYEDSVVPLTSGIYANNGTKIPVTWGVESTNGYLIYDAGRNAYTFKQNDSLTKYTAYQIMNERGGFLNLFVQRYYIVVDGVEINLSTNGGTLSDATAPSPRYAYQNGMYVPTSNNPKNATCYYILENPNGGYMQSGDNYVPIIADQQIPVIATATVTVGTFTATRYFRFNITTTG